MSAPRAATVSACALAFALVACARGSTQPAAPTDRAGALRALARCTFDEAALDEVPDAGSPGFARDASRIESALRRALRNDRGAYAVRAGRCESALTHELRAREPSLAELARAWGELAPLAQSPHPEDIALERAVRHVGNAWRAAAR